MTYSKETQRQWSHLHKSPPPTIKYIGTNLTKKANDLYSEIRPRSTQERERADQCKANLSSPHTAFYKETTPYSFPLTFLSVSFTTRD